MSNTSIDMSEHLELLSDEKKTKIKEFKNLFNLLIYDWNEQDENQPKKYLLIKKFENCQEISDGVENMFDKLFNIIKDKDGKFYFRFCLKIIYYYFRELFEVKKLKIDPRIIIKAQELDNDFKNHINKILIIGLNYSTTAEYQNFKDQYLKDDNGKLKQ